MQPVVRFENVSKRYLLGQTPTLRESLSRFAPANRRSGDRMEFWALRNANLTILPGETLGVIGPNGAGKSTMLKLISRITSPTSGRVTVAGRVSSLIELGAGFHPELSGRENIYLNGAILGLKRQEVNRLFDVIVSFAELERFIDTPVKRYSSGMYARLGFAVAAHVGADILLVDEVLSVGDYAFQHKCLQAMEKLSNTAKSVVFVSHNMFAVQSLCNRAILLAHGDILADGAPDEVIKAYQAGLSAAAHQPLPLSDTDSHTPITITEVEIIPDSTTTTPNSLCVGDAATIRINYRANIPLSKPLFHFAFVRTDGTICAGANAGADGYLPGVVEGDGYVEAYIDTLNLPPAQYFVSAYISNERHTADLAHLVSTTFNVEPQPFVDTRLGGYYCVADWRASSRDQPE
jgi:lipopolysaccharide transport system ATP-binding protein